MNDLTNEYAAFEAANNLMTAVGVLAFSAGGVVRQ